MTQESTTATKVARRLWARTTDDASAPEEVAAAADRACTQLRIGLGRWVGATGYRALLDRAIALARAKHPALGSLSCHGGEEPVLTAAVRAHGAAEVAAGMVAVVAALIDLLGRIIGEEMAVRLVEQAGLETGKEREQASERESANVKNRPSARGIVSNEPKRGRDASSG